MLHTPHTNHKLTDALVSDNVKDNVLVDYEVNASNLQTNILIRKQLFSSMLDYYLTNNKLLHETLLSQKPGNLKSCC